MRARLTKDAIRMYDGKENGSGSNSRQNPILALHRAGFKRFSFSHMDDERKRSKPIFFFVFYKRCSASYMNGNVKRNKLIHYYDSCYESITIFCLFFHSMCHMSAGSQLDVHRTVTASISRSLYLQGDNLQVSEPGLILLNCNKNVAYRCSPAKSHFS